MNSFSPLPTPFCLKKLNRRSQAGTERNKITVSSWNNPKMNFDVPITKAIACSDNVDMLFCKSDYIFLLFI